VIRGEIIHGYGARSSGRFRRSRGGKPGGSSPETASSDAAEDQGQRALRVRGRTGAEAGNPDTVEATLRRPPSPSGQRHSRARVSGRIRCRAWRVSHDSVRAGRPTPGQHGGHMLAGVLAGIANLKDDGSRCRISPASQSPRGDFASRPRSPNDVNGGTVVGKAAGSSAAGAPGRE